MQLRTWAGPRTRERELPYEGPPLAVIARTFARHKSDYHLGPFFSEGDRIHITRAQLELSVDAHLDIALMGYVDIRDGFTLVEICHWSPLEVRSEIEARAAELERGAFFYEREARLWGTPSEYVARLRSAGNLSLAPPIRSGGSVIRDEWDGRQAHYEYVYWVHQLAEASPSVGI